MAQLRTCVCGQSGQPYRKDLMSAHCQLTGVQPVFGNHVSHSHRRTRRRWSPNIQQRRYWVPSEGRFVKLTLSARAIKTIDKIGIERAVARIRARGERI
ncbi:50S ribosomal protein L28 [Nonomuraea gerenzanensis]